MEQFVVSARKYRPATFRSVVGQDHITETLKNAITRGHLAHAYLFTGPRGVGKTTCARIFAKAINCLSPTEDREACGECESCKAFNEGRSFSIHELDAASNNSVEDIRSLNEKVRIPPQVGKYSVYIIDEVHMLSAAAFNAFLKTLEEPPAYAVFILATTEKHKILPTILSRCQSYDFNRIRVEDTVEYLKYIATQEKVTHDDESLHIIARRADGGMRDALSMFDRVVSFCGNSLTGEAVASSLNVLDYNTYFEAIDLALNNDYASLLTLFDQILRRGFDGQLFLSGLCGHLRDLLVCVNPQTTSLLEVTGEVAERYRQQALACEPAFLFHAINLLTQADTTYKQATNRRLHVELALIKICGLKKKADGQSSDEMLTDLARTASYPMPAIAPGPNPAGTAAVTAQVPPAVKPLAKATQPVQEKEPAQVMTATILEQSTPPTVPPVPQQSISGFSITNLPAHSDNKEDASDATQAASPSEGTMNLSPEEMDKAIAAKYDELLNKWNEKQRPRIATALTNKRIENGRIIVSVPTEVTANELIQSKWEIELDLFQLTGFKTSIEIEITEVQARYKPVSTEDKLQYLVTLNANILKLRDELDLTI